MSRNLRSAKNLRSGRARWRPGCALGARYAERLGRSLAKLGAPGEVQSAWKTARGALMMGPRS